MTFHPVVKKMLEAHNEPNISAVDKIREILQQTALLGLARHHFFEHAVFYGGTALRILYGLDRYSEDLDFSLINPNNEFDFSPFIDGMHKELKALGFDLLVSVKNKTIETGIISAFLKANTLSLLLTIKDKASVKGINPEQKIQIKLEIDTDPPAVHLPYESKLILNPLPFYVNTYSMSDLFAGKMHAALCRGWKNRVKGRDWYDVIWYVQRNTPLNLEHLKARMIQTHHLDIKDKFGKEELLQRLHKKIDEIDWHLAKNDVSPFISDKTRLEIWNGNFFHDLANQIKVKG
ncbi:MAG: hypothetical protein BGO10_01275 [Chlamydia sp. 32-24]|nr:MAG: hypothetical protein BGO10_01275 [Chlamydia sp. 32-24]